MKTFRTMLKIELKLNIRDMNMVLFAIIMPVIVLIILGIVYGQKPAFDGAAYTFLEQSFGALSTIAICAAGVMGLPLAISAYRERKILKRYKVTPIGPAMLFIVQLVIYSLYSLVSLILVYIIGKLFFGMHLHGNWYSVLGSWFLVLISILSIGVLVGGIAKDSKKAGLIASILYFPMLIFSGATLPYEVMPNTVQKIVDFMPLTQGIKLLKAATLGQCLDQVLLPIIIMVAVATVCIGISIKKFRWE